MQSRLALRIDEITNKRTILSECVARLHTEMDHLAMYTDICQTEITTKVRAPCPAPWYPRAPNSPPPSQDAPIKVTRDCQALRAKRSGSDLIADDVDDQLAKELALLQQVKSLFQDMKDECTEQVLHLAPPNIYDFSTSLLTPDNHRCGF